jgi:hypothetical protein
MANTCLTGANVNKAKHCAECAQIVAEMRTGFLKFISKRPKGDLQAPQDFHQYLSQLFSSEAELARLREQWQQSEYGAAYHKWMEHRIATGHVPVLPSAFN